MSKDNSTGRTALIIALIVVVLAGGTGAWYWFMYKPAQEAKEKARLEQIAKEEAEKKRKEQEAKRKAKYDSLIKDADEAIEQENWETAKSRYAEAASLFPNQAYPKDQLVLVNGKLEEIAALEARKASAEVEIVSARTGRFYIIVSSSIDDDLAMDYAKKLAKEGNLVKFIRHNANELPFHGVSLADYDTWDQASAATSSFSTFGKVWVLKY